MNPRRGITSGFSVLIAFVIAAAFFMNSCGGGGGAGERRKTRLPLTARWRSKRLQKACMTHGL